MKKPYNADEALSAKILLRKVLAEETLKFVARGGKVKAGPPVKNSLAWSESMGSVSNPEQFEYY